ncbi:MAG: thiamine-phosphate pyrophosphorylase [Fibrobacteria bacterium]|nr:thiamine-phosphate pyrophosphorylase [Fibrobacteria bacterium]
MEPEPRIGPFIFGPMRPLPGTFPLYFVTDHALNAGRPKLEVIAAALRGGAKLIQYRDKVLGPAEFEAEARAALALCRAHGATLILNDHVAIAARIGADGVHLGQDDMHPAEARRLLGPDAIIGLSTHNEAEVLAAQDQPVSNINIGPMFATNTKDHLHALGLEAVLHLSRLSRHPWTTMGGIKREHLPGLFQSGVRTVSMVTEISLAPDVEQRVRDLLGDIGEAMNI